MSQHAETQTHQHKRIHTGGVLILRDSQHTDTDTDTDTDTGADTDTGTDTDTDTDTNAPVLAGGRKADDDVALLPEQLCCVAPRALKTQPAESGKYNPAQQIPAQILAMGR